MATKDEALNACPFCGGDAYFERAGTYRQSCIVCCKNCGARHESSDEDEFSGSSWNSRADTQEQPQSKSIVKEYFNTDQLAQDHVNDVVNMVTPSTQAFNEWFKTNKNLLSHHGIRVTADLSWQAVMQVRQVPDGWKLVPITPTEEMHAAAVRTIVRCSGNADFPPRVYRAMIAAAPLPPNQIAPAHQEK